MKIRHISKLKIDLISILFSFNWCNRLTDLIIQSASPGQWSDFPPLFDREPLGSVVPPEGSKPFVGEARSPGDELEQAESHLVGELVHHRPEPANHDVLIVVAFSEWLKKQWKCKLLNKWVNTQLNNLYYMIIWLKINF